MDRRDILFFLAGRWFVILPRLIRSTKPAGPVQPIQIPAIDWTRTPPVVPVGKWGQDGKGSDCDGATRLYRFDFPVTKDKGIAGELTAEEVRHSTCGYCTNGGLQFVREGGEWVAAAG